MIKTKGLIMLSELLDDFDFNLKDYVDIYKSHQKYNPDRKFVFSEYERVWKDLIVKDALNRINENGYLRIERFFPHYKKYNFKQDELGRVYAYRKSSADELDFVVMFENLIKVNGLLTIVESCVRGFISKKRRIREENIMNKILGKKRRNKFGYIIVCPEEYVYCNAVREFKWRGGLTSRFKMSKDEFRDGLREVLCLYGFKVRD